MSNIKNPKSNPLKSSAPVRPPGGDTAPKKVYVCSPFRPTAASLADRAEEQRSNIERALKACRILAMMGIQPLAPHLYFTRFLKDDVAAERDTGMRFALSWLEQADELWVFGERVSDGMAQEIAKAKELGKPVHTLPEPGRVAELLIQSISQKYNMSLTYEGVGQNHKWARQETYSGRLVENATQAIARDILAEAMARIEDEGLNIVAHVHDEVIIEAPKGKYTVEEICQLMAANPDWCDGLPLAAAGYKGDYYFKD